MYTQCFTNGKGAGRKQGLGGRGNNPTHLENVASNWSYPGQFYYSRKDKTIGYIPRPGETAADLEATATTATQQQILVVNGSKNLQFKGVHFEYATWLGASGNAGFIDTQVTLSCHRRRRRRHRRRRC